jgi:hypothetical protein
MTNKPSSPLNSLLTFNGEDVETREGNRDEHFADDKANRRQHVTLDKLRENTEHSATNHSEEERFFASDFVHEEIRDEVAGNFDETHDLRMVLDQVDGNSQHGDTHNEADVLVPVLEVNSVDVQTVVDENRGEPKERNVGDLQDDPQRCLRLLHDLLIVFIFQLHLLVQSLEGTLAQRTLVDF